MKISIQKLGDLIKDKYLPVNILYLFGSSVKGVVKKGSDIDIAVSVDTDFLANNPGFGLEIEVFLQEEFGVPVDVVILNKANSILKYQVIKHGIRLFERDAEQRSKVELCIIKEYFDSVYYQNKRNK